MKTETVALIANNQNDLDLLKSAIKEVNPSLLCISFVYADEALRVLSEELKKIPSYIFIDVNLRRSTGAKCLTYLRGINDFDTCKIAVYSFVMPQAVAESFVNMGADFAFQKPVSKIAYTEVVSDILKVEESVHS